MRVPRPLIICTWRPQRGHPWTVRQRAREQHEWECAAVLLCANTNSHDPPPPHTPPTHTYLVGLADLRVLSLKHALLFAKQVLELAT